MRAPYWGKSALVGRVLLSRPRFETITEVQLEIKRRRGSLSLGQVSKVLSALDKDLVVRKGTDGVKLIQPERLLDSLTESYNPPDTIQEASLKARPGSAILEQLLKEAKRARASIAGFEPGRHAIGPQPGQRLLVYVEPRGFRGVLDASGAEPSGRFPNLMIRAVKEPWTFFDPQEDGGFMWCSPLETYLQLMQGGKRAQDIALQFRDDILKKASADR